MTTKNEEKPPKMFAYGIFKVLYSPVEAFKNIVKKPNIKGPLLILLLVSIFYVGAAYINSSKILFLQNGSEVSQVQTEMVGNIVATSIIAGVFVFLYKWGVYAAMFIMITFIFRFGKFSLKDLVIVIGYTFSVAMIYYMVSIPLTSTYQPISTNITLSTSLNQTEIDRIYKLMWDSWGQLPAFYTVNYFRLVVQIWIAVLSGIAIRFLYYFSWKKAAAISAVASFIFVFIPGTSWY